jgi:hypothetical protein
VLGAQRAAGDVTGYRETGSNGAWYHVTRLMEPNSTLTTIRVKRQPGTAIPEHQLAEFFCFMLHQSGRLQTAASPFRHNSTSEYQSAAITISSL